MFGWIKARILAASPLAGRGAESGGWQIGAIGGLLLLSSLATHAVAACDWPEWQQFKQNYISEQGRVIDPSSPKKITTSEGQSYGLFFALVANDRAAFDNILQWTQNNLAQGDLSARLPAWLWGRKDKNQEGKEEWGVLDTNSASDSDLWIAYSLMEAGRLWKVRSYQSLGVLLLQRIAREEVVHLPGFGVMLLPGRVGFAHPPVWTINPSYLPPQLMARMAHFHGPWAALHKNNQRLLLASSPKGFVPDWIDWRKGKGWEATPDKPNVSGYDAIRVYLWAGMMADEDPNKAVLIKQWQPMATITAELGYPPERVNVATGKATGYGNSGFSAALLPFLAGSQAQAVQRQRVKDNPLSDDAYYSYVLTLFGQGWDQQRYRFNLKGELLPHWDSSTCVSIATSH